MCYTLAQNNHFGRYSENNITIRAAQRPQHWAKTHYPKNESHNDPFLRCVTVPMSFFQRANVTEQVAQLVILDFKGMHQWF